jgi:hypothetical protein
MKKVKLGGKGVGLLISSRARGSFISLSWLVQRIVYTATATTSIHEKVKSRTEPHEFSLETPSTDGNT